MRVSRIKEESRIASAADAAHRARAQRYGDRRIYPRYMASARPGIRRIYPISGVYLLKTARINPPGAPGSAARRGRQRYRRRLDFAHPGAGPPPNTTPRWRGYPELSGGDLPRRRVPLQHHPNPSRRLICQRRDARFGDSPICRAARTRAAYWAGFLADFRVAAAPPIENRRVPTPSAGARTYPPAGGVYAIIGVAARPARRMAMGK